MRKNLIAGNWKMNKLPSETGAFVKEVIEATKGAQCDVVVCTPFVCLPMAVEAAKGSHVKVGAENLHFEDKGAFTGEVSADMLVDLGVEYVIIGHSERRQYFAETDETVNKKTIKALEKGLKPIVCVGESLEERETGVTMEVIGKQVKLAYQNISADDAKQAIIDSGINIDTSPQETLSFANRLKLWVSLEGGKPVLRVSDPDGNVYKFSDMVQEKSASYVLLSNFEVYPYQWLIDHPKYVQDKLQENGQ